jgi:hypothetical protein
MAIDRGHYDTIKLLITAGVDVECASEGKTAREYCVKSKAIGLVELFD